jgi:hypothetical protein
MSTALRGISQRSENSETTKKTYKEWSNSPSLFRNPAWGSMRLVPLPLIRDESEHKYIWEPTGEPLAYSTTQITGHDKTPAQIAAIEATRSKWEPRGKTVHHCLEQFLLGNKEPDPGEYGDWVKPLLDDEFWDQFEPWGVEYMVCDLKKSVGGQLDVIGYDHAKKELVLIDLKTQSSKKASRYNTDAQLGSYVHAINEHHKIVIDNCKTIWARPGKCIIGPDQSPDICGEAWLDKWDAFTMKAETFD